jgi:hypothetical protein
VILGAVDDQTSGVDGVVPTGDRGRRRMRPGELVFESCTDDEQGIYNGWFTGEVLWTGAHVFQCSSELDNGDKLYVFPVEIVDFS